MPERIKRIRRERRRRSSLTGDETFRVFRHHMKPEKIALLSAGVVCAVVILVLTFNYGSRFYNRWHEGHLLKNASVLLQQHDYEGAIRDAQNVLQLNRDSLPAFNILAEATEQLGRIETVTWRAQIARLLPDKLDSQLNLASAALRFGELDTARKALEHIAPSNRNKASYHVVAGWLAKAEGDETGLEQHFAAAVKEEPKNNLYQYNLAVLQIKSSDAETVNKARATLQDLAKVPEFRTGALRALLSDAVAHNDTAAADDLAQDLQMSQQVTFADYLLCLDFYRKLNEKKFFALLAKVKPVAARNASDLSLLLNWMNENGMSGEALKWQEKLPADLTTHPPPVVAIAEALAQEKNWSRLKRWTRGVSWNDAEFLRLAYQAYAARQSRQSGAEAEFNSLWLSAEKAASDNQQRELKLARLAMKWNLLIEAEQLWLRISRNSVNRREALDALALIYRTNNDLPNLYSALQRLHETSPNDMEAAASYARLALLLEQNAAEGHRVAKEAYDRNPTDPNNAITYAFSLYGLGRTTEAIQIMNSIPTEQLLDPHIAVYAAVILLDENQSQAAREYVEAARHGSIFSEEKKLLDEAVAKTGLANANPAASPAKAAPSASPADKLPGPPRIPAASPTPPIPKTDQIQ